LYRHRKEKKYHHSPRQAGSVVFDPVCTQRRLIARIQELTHLAGTTIADKHELEGRSLLLSHTERLEMIATSVW
jgi:hypothetical protein